IYGFDDAWHGLKGLPDRANLDKDGRLGKRYVWDRGMYGPCEAEGLCLAQHARNLPCIQQLRDWANIRQSGNPSQNKTGA
ncbi:MAG TPA: hypothetical protein VGH91_06730, partial [Gammaproteobacteria bacterium]